MGIEGKNPLLTIIINLNIFSDENLKLNLRSPSYSTMFSVKTQEKSELQVENEPMALCELMGCSNHWATGNSVVSYLNNITIICRLWRL